MSGFQQRELVLLPFPFQELKGAKPRPVLIVSSTRFNAMSRMLVVVPMTTKLESGIKEYNVLVEPNDVDLWPGAQRIRKSAIKPYKLFTADKSLVMARIGILHEDKFGEVMRVIRTVIGLRPEH
ncbi:type II toxin-antitoxin system PemK/MazF family toxin [Thermococcus sp.]